MAWKCAILRNMQTTHVFCLRSLSMFLIPNKGCGWVVFSLKLTGCCDLCLSNFWPHRSEHPCAEIGTGNVRFFVTTPLLTYPACRAFTLLFPRFRGEWRWLCKQGTVDTVLTSFPFYVSSCKYRLWLARLWWEILQSIRQGAVICVFHNSDHIDECPCPTKASSLPGFCWEIQRIIRQSGVSVRTLKSFGKVFLNTDLPVGKLHMFFPMVACPALPLIKWVCCVPGIHVAVWWRWRRSNETDAHSQGQSFPRLPTHPPTEPLYLYAFVLTGAQIAMFIWIQEEILKEKKRNILIRYLSC